MRRRPRPAAGRTGAALAALLLAAGVLVAGCAGDGGLAALSGAAPTDQPSSPASTDEPSAPSSSDSSVPDSSSPTPTTPPVLGADEHLVPGTGLVLRLPAYRVYAATDPTVGLAPQIASNAGLAAFRTLAADAQRRALLIAVSRADGTQYLICESESLGDASNLASFAQLFAASLGENPRAATPSVKPVTLPVGAAELIDSTVTTTRGLKVSLRSVLVADAGRVDVVTLYAAGAAKLATAYATVSAGLRLVSAPAA